MQFMEDAMRYPLFLQDELVRERPVVTGEFDRNEANPFFHLAAAMDTLLWSPEYYSRKNVIGNRDVILSTTQEKMREIQHRYYVPNNTRADPRGRRHAGARIPHGRARSSATGRAATDPFATPIPESATAHRRARR